MKKNLQMVEASLSIPLNTLKRYNINVDGKRSSVTLEPKTWEVLQGICTDEETTVHDLCDMIAMRKGDSSNMSSAIRVFLIAYLDARVKYMEK